MPGVSVHAPVYSEDSCQITSKREQLFIVELRENEYGEREAPVVEGERAQHVN